METREEDKPLRFVFAFDWNDLTNACVTYTANTGVPEQQIIIALESWAKFLRENVETDLRSQFDGASYE